MTHKQFKIAQYILSNNLLVRVENCTIGLLGIVSFK